VNYCDKKREEGSTPLSGPLFEKNELMEVRARGRPPSPKGRSFWAFATECRGDLRHPKKGEEQGGVLCCWGGLCVVVGGWGVGGVVWGVFVCVKTRASAEGRRNQNGLAENPSLGEGPEGHRREQRVKEG